jgi:energy-coupling factor transporter ATP-binding protein EcfA2
VTNFRTFSHLRIERLGRVNLILGKNNVGKTTLLEALQIYVAEHPSSVLEHLKDREELLVSSFTGEAFLDYESPFHGRVAKQKKIEFKSSGQPAGPLVLDLAPLEKGTPASGQGVHHPVVDDAGVKGEVPYRLRMTSPDKTVAVHDPRKPDWHYRLDWRVINIGAREVPSGILGRWWDQVAGTTSEKNAVEALSVIAPIELVRIVQDPTRQPGRMFRVRLEGETKPVPLRSLGGGAFRMFQFVAAATFLSSQNPRSRSIEPANHSETRFLLIDEIENGIHYSLHSTLWRLIFQLAEQYNLQVFATTHSWDCLRGFAEAVAEDETNDGVAIRLEKVEGEEQTGAVIIDREGLPVIVRDEIEVR